MLDAVIEGAWIAIRLLFVAYLAQSFSGWVAKQYTEVGMLWVILILAAYSSFWALVLGGWYASDKIEWEAGQSNWDMFRHPAFFKVFTATFLFCAGVGLAELWKNARKKNAAASTTS